MTRFRINNHTHGRVRKYARRSASMARQKLTVFLPHEEGAMVQITVPAICSAHQLVKFALVGARRENGDEMPVGLIDDAWAYRAYVAEEDGEVDTDFPVCDVRMNICELGVESFVLRDRVDAANTIAEGDENSQSAAQAQAQARNAARPTSGSIQEGPGGDHSRNENSAAGKKKGFTTLETGGRDVDVSSGSL